MIFYVIPNFSEAMGKSTKNVELRKANKTYGRYLRARVGGYRKKAGSKMHSTKVIKKGSDSALMKLLKAKQDRDRMPSLKRSQSFSSLDLAGRLRRHGTRYGRDAARERLTDVKKNRSSDQGRKLP